MLKYSLLWISGSLDYVRCHSAFGSHHYWALPNENATIVGKYCICGYFAVVLFSQISRVSPRENFHFNIWLFIVMETAQKSQIKPSRISPPCPKSRKHLYAEYMAYQKDCTLPDIWIDKERQIESVDILGQVFSEQWNQLMMCLHCFLKRKKICKNKTFKRLPIID